MSTNATRGALAPRHDRYGLRLAFILGNQAPRGVCPFASRGCCRHCDIGLGEGPFDTQANLARIRHLLAAYRDVSEQVRHLVVYNSGSVLDPHQLPRDVLWALLAEVRGWLALGVLSLESREQHVDTDSVRALAERAGLNRKIRIIIGLETSNDWIRNELLMKVMPRSDVETAIANVAEANRQVRVDGQRIVGDIGFAVNVLVGGPGTTAATVEQDATSTTAYALDLASQFNLPLDLNVHPYYRSRRGLKYFPKHRPPAWPVLLRTISSISTLCRGRANVFVGLDQEGHTQDVDRLRGRVTLEGVVADFNRTGDISGFRVALQRLEGGECDVGRYTEGCLPNGME